MIDDFKGENLSTFINSINRLTLSIDIALEAIQNNNNKKLDLNSSIDSISDKLLVSTSHTRRLFKRMTGVSLSNYVTIVRMDKAKELLASTSLSINEISGKTGFINKSYFYTIFKKKSGNTKCLSKKSKN